MPGKTWVGVVAMMIGLAGCGTSPVRLGPDSDPRVARQLLAAASTSGPVRLEINELPPAGGTALSFAQVAAQAARGVNRMAVRFDELPDADGSARLILLFAPPAAVATRQICTAPALPQPAVGETPLRLQAIFCDGGTFIADASATAEGVGTSDVERLIWRTTGQLFPDDYENTYGLLHLLGWPFGDGGSVKP